MKMIEKILANREYCEKIANMDLEQFKAALAQRNLDTQNAEKLYNAAKTIAAGGELDDDDLTVVSGGLWCSSADAAFCGMFRVDYANGSGC